MQGSRRERLARRRFCPTKVRSGRVAFALLLSDVLHFGGVGIRPIGIGGPGWVGRPWDDSRPGWRRACSFGFAAASTYGYYNSCLAWDGW